MTKRILYTPRLAGGRVQQKCGGKAFDLQICRVDGFVRVIAISRQVQLLGGLRLCAFHLLEDRLPHRPIGQPRKPLAQSGGDAVFESRNEDATA